MDDLSKAGVPEATRTKIADLVMVRKARAARQATPPQDRSVTSPSAPKSKTTAEPAPKDTSTKSDAKSDTEIERASDNGQVWLNTDSKIYHRSGSRWYGKTKNGKFVTEKEAEAEGAREAKE